MHYFYVLLSSKDKKYYYGSTKDLSSRFKQHENGEVSSTKYRRPLTLVYYEAYITIEKARFREMQVKASGSIRKQLHDRLS